MWELFPKLDKHAVSNDLGQEGYQYYQNVQHNYEEHMTRIKFKSMNYKYGNNNYLFMVPAGKSLTALTIRLSSSLDQGSEDFDFSPAEVPLREKEIFYFIVQ